MIGIKYNNQFLYLPGDTNIRSELFSSLFYDEQGSYSYPFNLPKEQNSVILGMFDLMEYSGSQKKSFNVDLYLYNNYWKPGILRLKGITDKYFVVNINSDVTVLADIVKNKSLRDIDYGTPVPTRTLEKPFIRIKLSGTGTTDNVQLKVYTTGATSVFQIISPYTITVPFDTSIDQTLTTMAGVINADLSKSAYGILFAEVTGGDKIGIYSNNNNIVPVFDDGSVAGPDRTWTVDDIYCVQEVLDHMKHVIDNPDDFNYTFFPIKNDSFNEDPEGGYEYADYVNYYKDNVFWGSGITAYQLPDPVFPYPLHHYIYPVTPFPYFTYVLKKCMEQFGYKIKGKFTSDSDIKKLTIYNNFSADKDFYYSYSGVLYGRSYTDTIDIKNHVPNLQVADFLTAIKSNFFLAYFIDNTRRKFTIKSKTEILEDPTYEDWTEYADPNFIEDQLNDTDGFVLNPTKEDDAVDSQSTDVSSYTIKDPVNTLADLPSSGNSINDIRWVKSLNMWYKATLNPSAPWEFLSEKLGSYTVGNGKDSIDLPVETATIKISSTTPDKTLLDRNWWVPYIKQPGSNGFDMGDNSYGLRFLFYRGLVNDADSNQYPYGTPYNHNYDETQNGDYSLDAENIYNKFGKKWVDFLSNSRPVKINLPRIDENLLHNLDYSIKKRIKGTTFLLAKLDFSTNVQGKPQAQGLFYRVG